MKSKTTWIIATGLVGVVLFGALLAGAMASKNPRSEQTALSAGQCNGNCGNLECAAATGDKCDCENCAGCGCGGSCNGGCGSAGCFATGEKSCGCGN